MCTAVSAQCVHQAVCSSAAGGPSHLDDLPEQGHEGLHGAGLADTRAGVQHDVLPRHATPRPRLQAQGRSLAHNPQAEVIFSGHVQGALQEQVSSSMMSFPATLRREHACRRI